VKYDLCVVIVSLFQYLGNYLEKNICPFEAQRNYLFIILVSKLQCRLHSNMNFPDMVSQMCKNHLWMLLTQNVKSALESPIGYVSTQPNFILLPA